MSLPRYLEIIGIKMLSEEINNTDQMETKPIFVFSLPRSGSTMLQKILATSEKIATEAEPWVMLPLYGYDEGLAMHSVFSGRGYRSAISGLQESLPNGEKDMYEAARKYGSHVYSALADGKPYFLDKTPRYSLIAKHLLETFPDAKFIFLWRNPLSVMSSISKTWQKGKWSFVGYDIDLYEGLTALTEAFETHEDKCIGIKYEDLVGNPEEVTARLESYLELENGGCRLDALNHISFAGKMGDPTGEKEYSNKISKKSISKWEDSFSSKYRIQTGVDYLESIGSERLELMGYSSTDLEDSLSSLESKHWSLPDLVQSLLDKLKTLAQSRVIKWMLERRKSGKRLQRLD